MLERLLILSLVLTACDDGGNPGVTDGLDTGSGGMADVATEPEDEAVSDIDDRPSLIEGRPCPPDNATTYANTGGPILISWCVVCHSSHVPADQRQGATMGVDFDTVEGISEQLLRIYARAGDDNTTMPPVDSLTADERRRLGDWIACGAPGLEGAILPEPGDGGMVPDGGSMGGGDTGMGGRRDTGMGGGRDTGGDTETEGCVEDADCEAECARTPLGCTCVERRNGVRACVRNCEEDADCPGDALVCQDQLCQR